MNAPAQTSPSTQAGTVPGAVPGAAPRTTPRIPFKKRVAQSGVYVLGALVVILFAIALVGDKFVPYDPLAVDYANAFLTPNAQHWFGCDAMGRDLFSRVICGAKTSLLTTTISVIIPVILGCIIGFISAWCGGWVDAVLMRISDMFQAFPHLVLGVAIVGILGPGIINAVLAIIAVAWIRYARLTRSLILTLKSKPYVATCKMNGLNNAQIALKHLLPNIAPHVISMAMLDFGYILLTLASFSFLGLGIQPPTPEWGSMLNDGRVGFAATPHLMVPPGCALFLTVLVFNIFGNALSSRISKER